MIALKTLLVGKVKEWVERDELQMVEKGGYDEVMRQVVEWATKCGGKDGRRGGLACRNTDKTPQSSLLPAVGKRLGHDPKYPPRKVPSGKKEAAPQPPRRVAGRRGPIRLPSEPLRPVKRKASSLGSTPGTKVS